MVYKDTVMLRVRKGAALLDEKVPNWESRVRSAGPLTGEDMANTHGKIGVCGCIIGRTMGDFNTEEVIEGYHDEGDFGFDIMMGDSVTLNDQPKLFDQLAECWNDLLAEREAARAKQAEV